MKNFYKNLKGYSIGIAIFLFAIPVLMYYISTVLIFPIDLFIFKIIAIFLILTGVIFIILSNIYMIKKGKGCPADGFGISIGERTKNLITTGPYRYCRNPMLFATFTFYLGLSFLFNSYSALLIPVIFIIFMICYIKKYEEPRLSKDFKNAYHDYKKSTPMLFPNLK